PRWRWGLLLLLETARLLLWCPVYESHMIGNHIQAGALLAVVFVGAGFHTTAHGDLLFRALLDDVCEVFSVTTDNCHRVPGSAPLLESLRLRIEPAMRLSSSKTDSWSVVLRQLQTANLTNTCPKTYLRQLLVLLTLCCTIPANTDPSSFLLILR